MRETGECKINYNDDHIGLNRFEMNAFIDHDQESVLPNGEFNPLYKPLLHEQSRIYQYRDCPTCNI